MDCWLEIHGCDAIVHRLRGQSLNLCPSGILWGAARDTWGYSSSLLLQYYLRMTGLLKPEESILDGCGVCDFFRWGILWLNVGLWKRLSSGHQDFETINYGRLMAPRS